MKWSYLKFAADVILCLPSPFPVFGGVAQSWIDNWRLRIVTESGLWIMITRDINSYTLRWFKIEFIYLFYVCKYVVATVLLSNCIYVLSKCIQNSSVLSLKSLQIKKELTSLLQKPSVLRFYIFDFYIFNF